VFPEACSFLLANCQSKLAVLAAQTRMLVHIKIVFTNTSSLLFQKSLLRQSLLALRSGAERLHFGVAISTSKVLNDCPAWPTLALPRLPQVQYLLRRGVSDLLRAFQT